MRPSVPPRRRRVLVSNSAFCWWRDTSAQNALAEHTANEFTGQVTKGLRHTPFPQSWCTPRWMGRMWSPLSARARCCSSARGQRRRGERASKLPEGLCGVYGQDSEGIIVPTAGQDQAGASPSGGPSSSLITCRRSSVRPSRAQGGRYAVAKERNERRTWPMGRRPLTRATRLITQTLPWGQTASGYRLDVSIRPQTLYLAAHNGQRYLH